MCLESNFNDGSSLKFAQSDVLARRDAYSSVERKTPRLSFRIVSLRHLAT